MLYPTAVDFCCEDNRSFSSVFFYTKKYFPALHLHFLIFLWQLETEHTKVLGGLESGQILG